MASNDVKTRDTIIDRIKDSGLQRRHTGSGEFTGVLVCLLAIFGVASAARKVNGPYTQIERRIVWFWAGAALISLSPPGGATAWSIGSFIICRSLPTFGTR